MHSCLRRRTRVSVHVCASVCVHAWVGGYSLHVRSGTICLWGWEADISALKPSKAKQSKLSAPSTPEPGRRVPWAAFPQPLPARQKVSCQCLQDCLLSTRRRFY